MKGTDQSIKNHEATVHRADHFTDDQIAYMKENANRQEKIIGRIFYNNPEQLYGPAEMHEAYGFNWPITSTRRAFTNLTDDDILLKTDSKVDTPHGRSEHQWRWKRPSDFEQKPQQGDMFGKPKSKGPYEI